VTAISEDDLAPASVAALLTALDRATVELTEALARVPASAIADPSLLDGWSRAHVLAHLTNVADALVRMTQDALADRITAMYPGGRAERDAQIDADARQASDALLTRFEESSRALAVAWHEVPPGRWGSAFTETELGTMQFGRLIGLRLTEVEAHHADLGIGFSPRSWSPELTQTCLPLRVASLARFRRRPDADHDIDGSWLLACDDLDRRWRVETHHAEAAIEESHRDAPANARVDAVIRGSATDLTALLLGRQAPSMLAVSGDAALARAFKRASPGP
jgi:maleylpyruvate isomerase